VLFNVFNLSDYPSCSSVKYMLSALVQSEAAIVAIVITVTLIAVQLTASAYSPRVIDIFKKNVDMWILLLVYGISIFSGFIVLTRVPDGIKDLSPTLSFGISFALLLGIFTFVALFPYMWNIINLLNPKTIIDRLSAGITKENTLNYLKYIEAKEGTSEEDETSTEEEQIQPSGDKIKEASKEDEIRSVEDPVQPIGDIITRSLMNHDITTIREGLEKIVEQAIKIINSKEEEEEEEEKKKITKHFCKHLQRFGRLAVSKMDEESTIEVIENLKKLGKDTAKKGHGDAVQEVVKYSEKVGKTAAEKELYDAAWQTVVCLGDVGKTATEKELYDAAWQTVVCLGDVGKTAAYVGEKLESVVSEVVFSLKAVGIAAVEHATTENELESLAVQAAKSLGVIGKTTANVGLKKAKEQAILALKALEAKANKKQLNGPETQAVSSRSGIERTAMNERKKSLKMRHGKQHRFK
jgi:N-acetylglutamate synthase-like GNAT family acetyltransferase